MKVDHLCSSMGTSQRIASLLDHSFGNYMDKYLDKVNKAAHDFSIGSLIPHDRTSVNRNTVQEIYDYTQKQYIRNKDIESAAAAGIKEIQRRLSKVHPRQGTDLYRTKLRWDDFFVSSAYCHWPDVSSFELFQKMLEKFYSSLASGKENHVRLLFASGGKDSIRNYDAYYDRCEDWYVYI